MFKWSKDIGRGLVVMIAIAISAIPISTHAQTVASDDPTQPFEYSISSIFLKPLVSLTEAPVGYIGITTAAELNQVRKNLSANYILLNDIVFDETAYQEGGDFYNAGRGWKPIGNYGTNEQFKGVFDGNGKTISGLTQNISYWSINGNSLYAGLFGHNAGEIKNLGMKNTNIRVSIADFTPVTVGGIVGRNDGAVVNCYTSGLVSSPDMDSNTGGIVGENYGEVSYSTNTSTVSSYKYSGGVVGENYGSVKSCVNAGDVVTTNAYGYAGGIVSCNWSNVSRCSNTGYVQNSDGEKDRPRQSTADWTNTNNIVAATYPPDSKGIAAYNFGIISTCYTDGALYNIWGYASIGGVQGCGPCSMSNSRAWQDSPIKIVHVDENDTE
jgi:hypothetical protein